LIKIQPQPTKVLTMLASHPGRIVTREELRNALWGEKKYIDFEKALNFCVMSIRQALGDDAKNPLYLQTVARRGYRFAAAVTECQARGNRAAETAPGCAAGSTSTDRARPVLAVLPFEDISGEPGWSHFCAGMTAEVIIQFERLGSSRISVLARTTSRALAGSGLGLGDNSLGISVDFFVEGSIRREMGRIRVAANLFRSSDHTLVAVEVYECDLEGVLDSQKTGAKRIAQALMTSLLE
jgi:TolB-like protein